jgi:hypothetical protein
MAGKQELQAQAFQWLRARLPRFLWAATGLLIAAALVVLGIRNDLFRRDGDIDHWQTLITGGLAIAAALIGGYFVNAQIQLARSQEAERLRRRHAATRATMSLTLSALMEYARLCGRALRILYLSNRRTDVRQAEMEAFELPPVPADKIEKLAEIIEAGRPDVGKVIAQVLNKLQVQDGRLRSAKAEVLDPHSHTRSVPKIVLDDYIIDAADLYAGCEGLLDYARDESEEVGGQPGAVELLHALTLMGFHEQAFAQVKARINRRHGVIVAPIDVE